MSSIPGLYYFEDIVADSQSLIEELDKQMWTPLSTSKNSRLVQHYGYLYDYKNYSIRTKGPDFTPPIIALSQLLSNICIENNIISANTFNQCIVNNYNPGQGISKHIDLKTFGPIIGCFTLGGGATMRFTKDGNCKDIYVKPNSLYIMSGDARYLWTHEMLARKTDVVPPASKKIKRERRISITFRNVP